MSGAESQALERDLVVALFDAEEPPYFRLPPMGVSVSGGPA